MGLLPFSTIQFLDVFFRYNQAIWPMQIIFYILAGMVIVCTIKKTETTDRMIFGILGFLWMWIGLIYHMLFFSSISNIAYLFGIIFIIQGIGFWYFGFIRKVTGFHLSHDGYSFTGLVFILYSLLVYPIIGTLAGHSYPYLPIFGAPCPTTIFTIGVLLLADRKVPLCLVAIPLIWSCIGVLAALSCGIVEDYGLILAGVGGMALIIWKNRLFGSRDAQMQ